MKLASTLTTFNVHEMTCFHHASCYLNVFTNLCCFSMSLLFDCPTAAVTRTEGFSTDVDVVLETGLSFSLFERLVVVVGTRVLNSNIREVTKFRENLKNVVQPIHFISNS